MFFAVYYTGDYSNTEYFRTIERAYDTFVTYAEIPPPLRVTIEQIKQEIADRGYIDITINNMHLESRFFEEDL